MYLINLHTAIGLDPTRIRSIRPRSRSVTGGKSRRTRCQAIINWLSRYTLPSDAINLDQVQGYIEAFYLLCAIDEWQRAVTLIFTRLNTPADAQLHYHLKLWGYSQEQARLYEALIDHIEPKLNGLFLQFLGTTHQAQGNYLEAQQCLERSFSILQRVGDLVDQSRVLSNLAEVYYALGDYDQAIKYQETWLAIATALERITWPHSILSNSAKLPTIFTTGWQRRMLWVA